MGLISSNSLLECYLIIIWFKKLSKFDSSMIELTKFWGMCRINQQSSIMSFVFCWWLFMKANNVLLCDNFLNYGLSRNEKISISIDCSSKVVMEEYEDMLWKLKMSTILSTIYQGKAKTFEDSYHRQSIKSITRDG